MKKKVKLKKSNSMKVKIGGLTIKQIKNCKCDLGQFCKVHRCDCEPYHADVILEDFCRCKSISKEYAIRLKKLAKIIS